MGVSLCRGPLGKLGKGVHLQGTLRDSGRRTLEMEHLVLFGEPGSIKEGSGDGHLFPLRPRWETWERSHNTSGLCVEEGSGMGVSIYRGHVGEPGDGGPSTGNFEN